MATISTNARIARLATRFFQARCLFESRNALYAVVETTAPDIAVFKSTNLGVTWTEQDAANAPATHDSGFDFDAYERDGTIHISYYTAANTITVIPFDCDTNSYGASLGAASAAATTNMKVVSRADGDVLVFFASSADSTLLKVSRYEVATWTSDETVVDFGGTVGICDVVIDGNDIATVIVREGTANDLSYASYSAANAASVATVLDATAYSGLLFTTSAPYDVTGTDTVTVGYLDSDQSIKAYVLTLDGEAPHTTGDQQAVVGATIATGGGSFFAHKGTVYGVWYDSGGTEIEYSSFNGTSWATPTQAVDGSLLMGHADSLLGGIGLAYQTVATIVFTWIVEPDDQGRSRQIANNFQLRPKAVT